MAPLRTYEDNFHDLPGVITAKSKDFKAKAKAVITHDLPKWQLHAIKSQENEDAEEEDAETTLYAGII